MVRANRARRAGVLGSSALAALLAVGAMARAQDQDVKSRLLELTQNAVDRGAFGSPTFFVGKEMFFGKDRLCDVEEEIKAQQAAKV